MHGDCEYCVLLVDIVEWQWRLILNVEGKTFLYMNIAANDWLLTAILFYLKFLGVILQAPTWLFSITTCGTATIEKAFFPAWNNHNSNHVRVTANWHYSFRSTFLKDPFSEEVSKFAILTVCLTVRAFGVHPTFFVNYGCCSAARSRDTRSGVVSQNCRTSW